MAICTNCKQKYDKKWYNTNAIDAIGANAISTNAISTNAISTNAISTNAIGKDICFFCTNFLPMRDTYSSILLGIELNFMKSGQISRREYYNDFLDNLQKWSNWFNVFPTKEDKIYEEDLRKAEDWSRNYWHKKLK